MFSFNSPFGACPECDGLGVNMVVDPDLLIPDSEKSIEEGAFLVWTGSTSNYYPQFLKSVCEHFKIPQNVPVNSLTPEHMNKLLHGTGSEKIRFRYENDFGQKKMRWLPLKELFRIWNDVTVIRHRMESVSLSKVS